MSENKKTEHWYFKDQEEREKNQSLLNKKLEDFRQSLSGEDRKREDAVVKAIEILQEADVPFTTFFHKKHPNSPNEEVAVQYNNYSDTVKRREEKDAGIYNCNLVWTIWTMAVNWIIFNGYQDKVDKKDYLNIWAQSHIKKLSQKDD